MRRISCFVTMVMMVALLGTMAIGCSSSSNNDQGASFTLFSLEPGSSSIPLSTSDAEGASSTGALSGTYSFQNNLLGQGIRLQRVFLRFFVEGSDVQPPETTVALGAVLGPAGPGLPFPPGSPGGSLPPAFENIPNVQELSSFILPPEIMTWLNLNRSSLPEPPYSITIDAYGTGISTAGNRLDTNNLATSVTILPDVFLNPLGEEGEGDPEEEEEVIVEE